MHLTIKRILTVHFFVFFHFLKSAADNENAIISSQCFLRLLHLLNNILKIFVNISQQISETGTPQFKIQQLMQQLDW